jgi:hypothetical protein
MAEREGFDPSTRPFDYAQGLAQDCASRRPIRDVRGVCEASEREGFEPSRGLSPLLAFQASAFNRSTTSPKAKSTAPFIAVLASMLLVGAGPDAAQRHAASGHFNVPRTYVQSSQPDAAGNAVANASFETGAIDHGWYQCGDVAAFVTNAHPYAGVYDEYSGTRNGSGEPLGNSGVCQRVTIPAAGRLTVRLYQLSNEDDATFAYQEGDLLDDRGNVVVNLYKTVNNSAKWMAGRWNLTAYAGRTLWLYFGVHGDGYAKRATQQFVDDVVLATPVSRGRK